MESTLDPKLFRSVMGHFATGVTVVTYQHDGMSLGMTANAFMSVSLNPPLVVVSVRREARFSGLLKTGDRYGVSFLLDGQETLSTHFGGRPIDGLESPFADLAGMPVIRGALAQMVTTVVDVHPAGDHLLYIGQVEALVIGEERKPLIFYSGKYKRVTTHEPTVQWSNGDGW